MLGPAARQPKKKPRSSSTEATEETKDRGESASIQVFPPELLYYIISFLPVKDVVALGQTCRYFYEVCDSEGVWQRICRRLSPRLRDENSGGSRPWKRSAILNYTKGLYFQMFSGRRHFVSKTVAPLLSHGYRKFLPTKDHVFILDYNGTLFFLKNALVSSTMGHVQWRRACRYVVLCRSAKDFATDPRSDTVYRKYLYVLATREQPAAPGMGRNEAAMAAGSRLCDCVEVYLQSSGQRVFKMTFHFSMKFKQIVLVGQETERSLLLLTEEGKIYSLVVNETQLDQPRSYTVQLALRKVSKCLPHISIRHMHSNQSSALYLTDDGAVYFEVHSPGVYRDLFGTLHAFDPLDQQMPLALSLPAKVHYLKGPVDLWCGLNHTLVLSHSGDLGKDLMGCGCGAGGRLPGWPKGSASFVRLHIKVPPCVRRICSTRECLYMLSSHDIEEAAAYRELPASKAGLLPSDTEAMAARACEEYLSQLHKCRTLEGRMAKMKEAVGSMPLMTFQKDFFWEALDMIQRAAELRGSPPSS
ncbi:F-box only protein 24 isoform X2 [Paroedura picta]|uniref:F-box only protein 24 isoform X2 n=1 Tax=Paroedura picta TaxID=143630 RepID=UPI004057B7E3